MRLRVFNTHLPISDIDDLKITIGGITYGESLIVDSKKLLEGVLTI